MHFLETDENPGQEPNEASEAERDRAIERFDEWFRYAETIGQQRLQSFLQTSSILLAACALFLSIPKKELYSLPFSMLGIVFSLLWIIKGFRQSKFHKMMEMELDDLLRMSSHREFFPGHHVRKMKSTYINRAEFSLTSNTLAQAHNIRLSRVEDWMSARKFLWIVPSVFLCAYAGCAMAAIMVRA